MKHWYIRLVLLLLTTSCQQGVNIQHFDENAFKQDEKGCAGVREGMKEKLFNITSQLKGLTQTQIRITLGKPDHQELAERGQKYFVYYIEPSPICHRNSSGKAPLTMYIRFSALDHATEISFKNY